MFSFLLGFFSMWGFGKSGKQSNHTAKRAADTGIIASLELIGDLIGHSSSVQVKADFASSKSEIPCAKFSAL